VALSLFVPMLHGRSHEFALIASVHSGADALQGLFIGSGLVLWIALLAEEILKKEAMGFGDVKFVGMIGAFCGWQGAVCSIFGGALVGTVWFAIALVWQKISPPKKPAATTTPKETPSPAPAAKDGDDAPGTPEESGPLAFGVHVPFGPMLAIGALLYFLVADRWVASYFAQISELM